MTENDTHEGGVELIHCGGCKRHSLLEDAKAAASGDKTDIDELHCPRCGTRVSYDETTVEMFTPRSVDAEADRGVEQQPQYLAEAAEEIENAVQCHIAGMMDPAFSSATTAEAMLESYRKGPIPTRDHGPSTDRGDFDE